MIMRYSMNTYGEEYVPTIIDEEACKIPLNLISPKTKQQIQQKQQQPKPTPISVTLHDSSCNNEQFDRLYLLSYGRYDVLVVCFDIMRYKSLLTGLEQLNKARNYTDKHPKTGIPVLLVGCKEDHRDNLYYNNCLLTERKECPVSKSTAKRIARLMNISAYVTCSAKTGKGVKEVMELCARLAILNHLNIENSVNDNKQQQAKAASASSCGLQ